MATARMMAIAAGQEDADDLVGGEVPGIL